MNGKQQRVLQQSQSAPDADETIIVSLDPESGISDQLRRRLLLRRFWQGAKGFWGAAGGRRSWLLTGAILLLILLNLAASYGMNIWNRDAELEQFPGDAGRPPQRVRFAQWRLALLLRSICATFVYSELGIAGIRATATKCRIHNSVTRDEP